MQVQVILGSVDTSKNRQLSAIQDELKAQGIEAPILVGEQCTTPFFMSQIEAKAMAGAKQFLADACTPSQINAVLALRAQGSHSCIPFDFVIHLVRQASGWA